MVIMYRQSYQLNGVCRFENFPECLDNPMEMELGSSGGAKWFMKLKKWNYRPTDFHPEIYFKHSCEDFEIGFWVYFNVMNHTWRSFVTHKKMIHRPLMGVYSAHSFSISEALTYLDLFLMDGAFCVEYGIHVESTKMAGGVWNVHFNDKLFVRNEGELKLKLDIDENKTIHCSKQILLFHSPFLSLFLRDNSITSRNAIILNSDFRDVENLEKCLQIAHGVRLKLNKSEWEDVIGIAEKLKLRNVVRYCEQQLIEQQIWPITVFCYNRNRYMKHSLKWVQSLNQFKNIYDERRLKCLSSGIIKMIMDKFMETEF